MNSKKDLTESELYNIGAAYCSGAEHCLSEVRTKLMRGTDDEGVCDRVLQRLVSERFIDEDRYARAFVNDKLRFAKWGRKKIQQELWRKEISESVYRPILNDIDERQYVQTLSDLLKAKRKSLKAKDEYDLKVKLLRFGTSRGFEPRYIYAALDMEEEAGEEYESEMDL